MRLEDKDRHFAREAQNWREREIDLEGELRTLQRESCSEIEDLRNELCKLEAKNKT